MKIFYEIYKELFNFIKNNQNLRFYYFMLLKGIGLIFCDDINLMIKYGINLTMYLKNEACKIIYYGIFTDFLLTHPTKEINDAIDNIQENERDYFNI